MSKKINILKFVLYIILIFGFFKPRSVFLYGKYINLAYTILPIISTIIIFMLSLRKKKISKSIIYMAIYMLILIISTLINDGDISSAITTVVNSLGLVLIVNYGLRYDTKIFLRSISFYLYLLVMINLLSIFAYPNGMYVDSNFYSENWFLGYKNIQILFILPAILFNFINSYYNYDKLTIKDYILLIVSVFTLIYVNSSTSIIGISIILIYVIMSKILTKLNFLNIKNFIIAYVVSFFSIVIFRIQNLFAYIISSLFSKDVTFTGRIYIWDSIINFIKNQPILGYGVEYKNIRYYKTTLVHSYHAHDQMLEIAYETGAVGIITFCMMAWNSLKKLLKYKDNKIARFISITMLVWFVMMLTEAYNLEYFLYFFIVSDCIESLIKNGGVKE